MLAHVAHVSWGLKHRIAHGVHGHEFMTSHHVHMTRHELMSNTPLKYTSGYISAELDIGHRVRGGT